MAIWIDTWAPAQWTWPTASQTTQAETGPPNVPNTSQAANAPTLVQGGGRGLNVTAQDFNVSAAVGGAVVLALLTVYVLHQLGFRFVVSASVGR